MTSRGADPLLALDGLTAVIKTEEQRVPAFVAQSSYVAAKPTEDEPTRRRSRTSSSIAEETISDGVWTVTIGCEQAWWGVALRGEHLRGVLQRYAGRYNPEGRLTREGIGELAEWLLREWNGCLLSWSGSPRSMSIEEWTTIFFNIGPAPLNECLTLRLGRLSSQTALKLSTSLLIASGAPKKTKQDTKSLEEEVAQMTKKLEASQQALRDERHKYRAMLTSSPSSSGRGRMSYPSTPSRKGRGSSHASILSSSPSNRSSSSQAADNVVSLQPSNEPTTQRNLSLVNPMRAFRAPPSQNGGFVGDSDSD